MARLRSRYMPSAYRELGSIANQCLVEFTDNQSVAHKLVEFVVQASCNDITVGAIYHLLTIDICRDVLGREPDFYEFVGRRHVQVTTQTRYPDPPPNPNLEHVHKSVTYQPIGETRSPKNAGRLASASGPR